MERIAFVGVTWHGWAYDGLGRIRANSGAVRDGRECTSSSGVAGIGCAWRGISAGDNGVDASRSGIAAVGGTCVVIVTTNGSVDASSGGIARISSASIIVVASGSGVNASVSIDSNGAEIVGTGVSITTNVGAQATLSTSAVSQASSSTWVSGDVNTSGSDKSIENGGESREVISVKGSLDSIQTSSDILNLISVDTADSNGEENDSSVLSGVQGNGVITNVVCSISKDQEDSRNGGVGSRNGSSVSSNIIK